MAHQACSTHSEQLREKDTNVMSKQRGAYLKRWTSAGLRDSPASQSSAQTCRPRIRGQWQRRHWQPNNQSARRWHKARESQDTATNSGKFPKMTQRKVGEATPLWRHAKEAVYEIKTQASTLTTHSQIVHVRFLYNCQRLSLLTDHAREVLMLKEEQATEASLRLP